VALSWLSVGQYGHISCVDNYTDIVKWTATGVVLEERGLETATLIYGCWR
jgi:hypothetical protein